MFSRKHFSAIIFLSVGFSLAASVVEARGETPPGQQAERSGTVEVQGETRRVTVPMITEPWSATASLPQQITSSAARGRRARFMGHFRGFKESKARANRALRESLQRQGLLTERGSSAAPTSLAPGLEAPTSALTVFDGPSESDTDFIPPDPQIAAGPSHVVVVVNELMGIYDKTGNRIGAFQPFSSFFSSLHLTGNIYDPRLIYDQTNQRFILSAGNVDFTNFSGGRVVLAISQTSDPTGAWSKYALNFLGKDISSNANTLPDFPTLGLSSSAVYISTSQFVINSSCMQSDTCYFSDTWVQVVGLPELLAGNSTLTTTTFKNVHTASGKQAIVIQPAVTYGSAPAEFLAAAEYYASTETTLNLFSITTSGTPTLTAANLTVPAFSIPPDAPQPGSYAYIFTNDYRLLNAVWVNGSLWCGQNATSASDYNSAARWYEINLASLSTAALAQSGEVNGSGGAYYPALALKADGSLGIAFTTSSRLLPASSAYTLRLSSDPAGTTRGFALYRAGGGPYQEQGIDNRWGDYSGASEDPDGGSLWFFTEYAREPDPNAHFGTAVAQIAGPPMLSISPSSLDFGRVLAGSPTPPQTVTISNIGSDPVLIGQLAFRGANGTSFSLTNDQCTNTSLAAAQTCTVGVIYTPSPAAQYEFAFLTVPYDNGNSLLTAGVQGTGANEAILTFSPASLTFPDTPLHTMSSPQTVTVQNSGNMTASISSLNASGSFVAAMTCGFYLDPGATCQVSVKFYPFAEGTISSWVTILSSAQPAVTYLSVKGTGVTAPGLVFCPPSLAFSNQAINTTSDAQSVILTNSGSGALTITNVAATGDFTASSNCVASIAPRATCELLVTFTPTAAGTRTGTISMTDDATGSPQTVALTGAGTSSLAELKTDGNPMPSSAAALATQQVGRSEEGNRLLALRRPWYFEPNAGQFEPGIDFVSRSPGYAVAMSRSGVTFSFDVRPSDDKEGKDANRATAERHPEFVKMSMRGAERAPKAVGLDELPGVVNYFRGRDPAAWRTHLPTYGRVKFQNVYPGTDVVYYGNGHQLEYDFVVSPGADPERIRLAFDGASDLWVEENGDLSIESPAGTLRFRKPVVYQPRQADGSSDGPRDYASGNWVRRGEREVAILIGPYDHSRPLVIDPVLVFSTYLGGSGGDKTNALALDADGNPYITGITYSLDFPVTSGALKTNCGTQQGSCVPANIHDAFVAKLSADGSELLYATYLGGSGFDTATAIAVDASGNAYVTGSTTSVDFPTTPGSFQVSCSQVGASCKSAFVTKLSPTGSSLAYSTYL